MLKFYTPDRKGKQEPYSYRARARLVGKCIDNIGTAFSNDIVVLGRIHKEKDVESLRNNNIPYIHDICDNKWPELEKLWSNTNEFAIAITTTCEELKKLIETKTDKPVYVVPDPTEREQEPVIFETKQVYNGCYYGSYGNLKQIDFNNYDLSKVNLNVMSNEGPLMWSFEAQGKMVRESDLVILPVNNDHAMTKYKGHNRPIDAIRQGKFVITNATIPSWVKLKDYMWVGDINEGIKWAINNPSEVIKKVGDGQSFIEEFYTPEKVKILWEQVYNNVCDTRNS
jgi:hypothetical protein